MLRVLLGSCIVLVTFAQAGVAQRTLNVPRDYSSIQKAIAAAVPSDTVLVAPGTYRENVLIDKAITVRSSHGPAQTTIDGQLRGSVVRMTAAGLLDGFRLENGSGELTTVRVLVCQLCPYPPPITLTATVMRGGGIYAPASGVTIRDNHIVGNSCSIPTNVCGYGIGGGIEASTNAIIQGNRIQNNFVSGLWCPCGQCPGVFCGSVRAVGFGSGLVAGSGSIVADNEITQNSSASTVFVPGVLLNNVIAHNGGPGLGWQNATLINNTIVGNAGLFDGAGYNGIHTVGFGTLPPMLPQPSVIVVNSIVRGNGGDASPYATYSHCNVQGVAPGNGNIDLPAGMVADALGDFHLRHDSPCRDAGINAVSRLPLLDFEGDPRIADGTVDMGADEFHLHLYVTGALTPGGRADLKIVGKPGSNVLWAFSPSSKLLSVPVQIPGVGAFYLPSPFFPQPGGTVPSIGVQLISIPIPLGTPAPTELTLQALVGTRLTNPLVLLVK